MAHMNWLPMDTYPPPNKRVLVTADNGDVGVAYWEPDAGWLMEFDEGIGDCEPIAWMPLPDPAPIPRGERVSH